MSRSGRLIREFGDGRHEFFLDMRALDELDETLQVGPGALLRRLSTGDFRSRDIRTIIRLGLIGGGMQPVPALKMIERYVDPPNPLMQSLELAIEILGAAVLMPEIKRKKKPERKKTDEEDRIDFDRVYGNGAVMGMSAEETGSMSLYQYSAAVEGFQRANSIDDEKGEGLSREQFRQIMDAPIGGYKQ